jgi:transaldolase
VFRFVHRPHSKTDRACRNSELPLKSRVTTFRGRAHGHLWASTSTKDPTLPDTLYVDRLIGPDTVTTLPEPTIDAFEDHGTVARTIDDDPDEAAAVLDQAAEVGVDLDDVGRTLEAQGVAAFARSFTEVLGRLDAKITVDA